MTQEEFFKRYTYNVSHDYVGGGHFGKVYKAYDNVLHREVAIKVSEVTTTADGKKTFSLKDEFEALSHVPKPPNIANYEEFYSYESPQGVFDYAVMQYYPDGNLSNAIKQGLTAKQKEDIATQLLEGIGFLHKHKVVHRDLKPSNILIVRYGGKVIPLVTDFGLSKAAGVVDGSVFSNSFGAGTPKYSSPEQLQGKPLRFNTDLWSYGAILYELFTGKQLFSAGSGAANSVQADMEIYNKIVNGNVQSLGKMPEKWRKVAERCLVVDATKRVKSAAELLGIIYADVIDGDETEVTEVSGTKVEHIVPAAKTPQSEKNTSSHGYDGKPKKGLWVSIGVLTAVALLLLLLLKPKIGLVPESMPIPHDPEEQAYHDCLTVEDYRGYIAEFGEDGRYYSQAKHYIDSVVADSTDKVLQALADEEDAAYRKCETIAGCNSYLKKYPNGRYVEKVKSKKAQLEEEEKKNKEKPSVDDTEYDEEEPPVALQPLPKSEIKAPDFVYYFRKDSYSIDNKYMANKSADTALKELLTLYSIKGFKVVAYSSPEEAEYCGQVSWRYANAVENHIKQLLKQKKMNVNKYEFETKFCGSDDWDKIISLIEFSGMQDKDEIVKRIAGSENKERTIRELSAEYPQLENIFSLLRRAEVYVY